MLTNLAVGQIIKCVDNTLVGMDGKDKAT